MDADGRNLKVVVATPDVVNFPAWGSHPRRVIRQGPRPKVHRPVAGVG
jgi:hypothetical protein